MTDLHIKSGIHGAMIVYPRNEVMEAIRAAGKMKKRQSGSGAKQDGAAAAKKRNLAKVRREAWNEGLTALVDAVDQTLTGGQMPAAMKNYIINEVSATQGNLSRAQDALFLAATSAFYQVEH